MLHDPSDALRFGRNPIHPLRRKSGTLGLTAQPIHGMSQRTDG